MNGKRIVNKPRHCNIEFQQQSQTGFTLIEIMVVVVIIGMLATMILPRVLGRLDQSQQIAAKADINRPVAAKLMRISATGTWTS